MNQEQRLVRERMRYKQMMTRDQARELYHGWRKDWLAGQKGVATSMAFVEVICTRRSNLNGLTYVKFRVKQRGGRRSHRDFIAKTPLEDRLYPHTPVHAEVVRGKIRILKEYLEVLHRDPKEPIESIHIPGDVLAAIELIKRNPLRENAELERLQREHVRSLESRKCVMFPKKYSK